VFASVRLWARSACLLSEFGGFALVGRLRVRLSSIDDEDVEAAATAAANDVFRLGWEVIVPVTASELTA
jgi:hypothetical protein